jgi:hypothetical protein
VNRSTRDKFASGTDYQQFLASKRRVWNGEGVAAPGALNARLFAWQSAIVRWALQKGRAAIWADCGLGKTIMQVEWARVIGGRGLIFAPLCVAEQTVDEAAKFGVLMRYAARESEAGDGLTITNYERLDGFDLSRYRSVVIDESSILKAMDGKTRGKLIAACASVPYRLCCTATPSPNDIAELANHAEFLGLMTRPEFLATWFVKLEDGRGWRLKGHAREPFFRWLSSWAVALRSPADLGYANDGFTLPPLRVIDHVLTVDGPSGGALFPEMGVSGIGGRLAARRASLEDRTQAAADLIAGASGPHADCQWLIWCGLNSESERLARLIPGAVEVSGSDSAAEKSGAVRGFTRGDIRVLVSKPKILGFGMNFQCCHHMAFVGLSDSYEAYYQCVRRSWRFGQREPVEAHVIFSEAERVVVENVRRKEAAATALSSELTAHMGAWGRTEDVA